MIETAVLGTAILIFYAVLGYVRPVLALLTMPLIALAIVVSGIGSERADFFLFAFVLVLVTLIAIAVSEREAGAQQWFHKWAFWALVVIAVFVGLVGFLLGFGLLGAGMMLPALFILGAVALAVSVISYSITSRTTRVIHIFSTLGSSMRQNLPLPMALDCAATGREDSIAWTLRGIKKWLVQGYSLVEAIRRGYPQCPAQALALLTAAERVGQLPAAIEAIGIDAEVRANERTRIRPVHPIYPIVVLCIMFLLLLGLMTFVIPQYQAVLQEMVGGELPAATQLLLGIMEFVVYDHGGLVFLLLLGLVFVVAPGLWLRGRFCQRKPDRPYLSSRIGDWLKWHLPIVHWFERNRSTLQVVELLRLGAKAGCPVNEAIRSTLELDVNLCFRARLARWLRRVESGENIATAARKCRLGSPLAWAFEAGMTGDGAPAVLEMLESFYRSNYSFRVNLSRFILWPCAIIVLGMTVGFVVIAVFLPGVSVITSLTGHVYP
jgi:type II secretory pathway component PulF